MLCSFPTPTSWWQSSTIWGAPETRAQDAATTQLGLRSSPLEDAMTVKLNPNQTAPTEGHQKAAIFDLDGVVLATERVHAKAGAETLNGALQFLSQNWKTMESAGQLKVGPSFDPAKAFLPFTHGTYLDY